MNRRLKRLLGLVINPRFLFCFGIGWLITNGWSYIMLGIGTYFEIDWMTAITGAYIAFLRLPISPEKKRNSCYCAGSSSAAVSG